jgi:hypothetical protein
MSPYRRSRLCSAFTLVFLLSGCAHNPAAVKADGVGAKASEAVAKAAANVIGGPLIPDATIQLGPAVSYPLEKLVYWGLWVGAAWLILDPLAPNWRIEETRLPEDHVHFRMEMKRYHSGGAGEARVALDQRARSLMRAGGYVGYELVEYSEGMESALFGAQRTASGVIRLRRAAG